MPDPLSNRSVYHETIAEQNVVERYLMGKLPAVEAAQFEEHFVDCPFCLDLLETTERFRAGLEPMRSELAPARVRLPWPRSAWAALAASLLLTAGVTVFWASRESAMRGNLEQARTAARNAAAQVMQPKPLVGATFLLDLTRGQDTDASEPEGRVTVSGQSQWVVLVMQGEVDADFQRLRATLMDAAGKPVWQQDGLRVAPHEELSLVLPSGSLRTGDYGLMLEGLARDGQFHPAGRYRFHADRR